MYLLKAGTSVHVAPLPQDPTHTSTHAELFGRRFFFEGESSLWCQIVIYHPVPKMPNLINFHFPAWQERRSRYHEHYTCRCLPSNHESCTCRPLPSHQASGHTDPLQMWIKPHGGSLQPKQRQFLLV